MIDATKLIACGVNPTQAKLFAPHIQAACERFRINSPAQQAAFIAQAMHESANFTRLEESTYYSKPETIFNTFKRLRPLGMGMLAGYCKAPQALANLAYANINGNGDESSGDGWRFRGRGLFQLTGRANYMAAGDAAGKDYKGHPELVAQPQDAALTAGWFWDTRGLNQLMLRDGIDAVSRRINGGANGLEDRRRLYAACLEVLS